MRHQFTLPEDDEEQIVALNLEWEAVHQGKERWLLVHGFQFPRGYNQSVGSLAIQIPDNYPVAGLDMAYFYPHLQRVDGRQLRQTQTTVDVDNKSWQRWSRHYVWVPGQHNLGSHIVLVRHWLEHGLGEG